MKFTETAIWKDLVNENKLPGVEVETTVKNETIWKLTLAMILVIIVTALVFYAIKRV